MARTGELAVSSKLAHTLITDPALVAHLAPKEREVFELLAQGVGRADIGKPMEPPVQTSLVDTYFRRVAQRHRELGRPTFNAYETLRHVLLDGHVQLTDASEGSTDQTDLSASPPPCAG